MSKSEHAKYKLAFDISIAPRPQNGIGVYAFGLIKALMNLPEFDNWQMSVICAWDQDEKLYKLPQSTPIIRLPRPTSPRLGNLRIYQVRLPNLLSRGGFDVYHAPGNSIALQAATPPIWSAQRVHRVITVHDVIPVVYPAVYPSKGWRRNLRSKLFALYIKTTAKNASIITSSNSSARDLNTSLHVPLSQIHVIPIGVTQSLLEASKNSLLPAQLNGARYILHVGTGNLNKNIPGVLDVYAKVRAEMPNQPLKLVLVGNYPDRNVFIKYGDNLASEIEVFSNITSDQMAALYRNASALVFPSFYEGFGLPCLEAMSLGCPVVASNASSLPEVVGNGGELYAPTDTEGMAQCVIKILNDKDFAQNMSNKGLMQAALFTWPNIAQKTLNVYTAVMRQQ